MSVHKRLLEILACPASGGNDMNQTGLKKPILVIAILAIGVGLLTGVNTSVAIAQQITPVPRSTLTPAPTSAPLPAPAAPPVMKSASAFSAIASVVESKLPIWVDLWRQAVPGFEVSKFSKTGEGAIKSESPDGSSCGSPQPNQLREIMYVYSPDKTRFVDPRVYLYLSENNGKIEGGFDADSAVALFDLRSNECKRVLFCGTPCGFDDAVWIDNNRFVVVGDHEHHPKNEERCAVNTKCTWVASLHVFDLSANVVTVYVGPETESRIDGYLPARFPMIDFE